MFKTCFLFMVTLCFSLIAADGNSVYLLESSWTNQDGKTSKLSELRGKARLVAMAFTGCEYACPLIVEELKKIDRAMSPDMRKRYEITFFSIDPENDTVEKLKKYMAKKKLDPARWSLWRGNEDAVRELAAVLDFKYKKDSTMGYSHSNQITVLDEKGVIRHQQDGMSKSGRKKTIQALKSVLTGLKVGLK